MLLDQFLSCSRLPLDPTGRSLAGEANAGFAGLGLRNALPGSCHTLLFHIYYSCNANQAVPLPNSFRFAVWRKTDFCWNLFSTTYPREFRPVIWTSLILIPSNRVMMSVKSGSSLKQ